MCGTQRTTQLQVLLYTCVQFFTTSCTYAYILLFFLQSTCMYKLILFIFFIPGYIPSTYMVHVYTCMYMFWYWRCTTCHVQCVILESISESLSNLNSISNVATSKTKAAILYTVVETYCCALLFVIFVPNNSNSWYLGPNVLIVKRATLIFFRIWRDVWRRKISGRCA